MIKVKLHDKEAQALLRRIGKAGLRAKKEALVTYPRKYIEYTKRRLTTGARSGRFYRKRGGRLHQSSAFGEYPAKDTGELSRSGIIRGNGNNSVRFGYTARHAKFLEEKSPFRGGRPFTQRALGETRRFLEISMNDELKKI